MQNAVNNTEIYGRQPTQPDLRCFTPTRVNISKTCFGNRKLVHLEIAGYQTSLVLHMVALRVAASRFQGDLSRPGSGPCLSVFPVPFPVLVRPQPCAPRPAAGPVVLPARLGVSGRLGCWRPVPNMHFWKPPNDTFGVHFLPFGSSPLPSL